MLRKTSRSARRTPRFLIATVGATVLFSACSSTAFEDPDQALRRELQALRSELVELQKKSVVSEVEILRLREKVAELQAADQRAEERLQRAPVTPPASSRPRPTTQQPVVRAPLPAAVEVTDLDDFGTRRADPRESIGTPLPAGAGELVSSPSGVAVGRPVDRVAVTPNSSEKVAEAGAASIDALDGAAQALYDRGFTEYHEGRYLEAEASLQRFLEGFPRSQWSDNALYWIGEARFARRDYRGALAAFRETADRFPDGNKVPDALLKGGQALEQLGDARSARQNYEEVSRRFPDTATALIAEERLRQLDR